ncbi:MAG: FAD-binding protein [Alphaproteobacteria bacterium]|jgi:FAD-linked oxidoreductase|nr:FAD-binding protein [Alphaproteobacteria bacterium]
MSHELPVLAPLRHGEWANWARNQSAHPQRMARPRDTDALRELVRSHAPAPIRPAGSGHSFTPLCATTGTLVSLDELSGLVEIDHAAATARLGAGTVLKAASRELDARALAFRNLGDINVQTLAGAIATATHGTGARFGCLSSEVRAVRLMVAGGDIITASRDQDEPLLRAAQVSLGALGLLTEAEIQLMPAYNLHRRVWSQPIGDILASAEALWAKHRNFEFFYIPFSGHGICIAHDETDAAPTPRAPQNDDEETMGLKSIRDGTMQDVSARRAILHKAMAQNEGEDVVGVSWQLLASPRNVPFKEMEYHLPLDGALGVFEQLVARVEAERPDVFFPIEVRMTAGDDAMLSPFQGAPRISIAVHAYFEDDHDWFFSLAEPLFRAAGGRPHWGKLHSLGARELSALYPEFEHFNAIRRELDPPGLFRSPYLAQLLGETPA